MRFRHVSSHSLKRGFTLLETVITLVVLGILAGISVFGFSVVRNKVSLSGDRTELAQVAQGALATYVNSGDWQNAVTVAAAEITSTGKTFSIRADSPGYSGDRFSSTYGMVSWRAGEDETLGLAMKSSGSGCVYAYLAGRNVKTWERSDATSAQCSGRYALSGSAMTALVDPDTSVSPGSGLTVVGGYQTATLIWTSSATEFIVTRGGVELPGRVTGTTFTDVGLDGGVLYSYTITPVNGSVRGVAVGPVAALTTPNTPTGMDAVSSGSDAIATWVAVSGQVDGYKLYRNGAVIYTGRDTSYVNAGVLTSGASYSYTVTAYNQTGESPQAAPAAVGTVPGAPSSLVATPGDKQAALTWTDSTGADGYDVLLNGKVVGRIPQGISTTSVTKLTNGTTYTVGVRPYNVLGVGTVSQTTVVPYLAVGAVSGFTATGGDARVTLTWTELSSSTANPLGGYRLYQNSTLIKTLTPPAARYVVTGLTNYTSYTFAIEAFYQSSTSAISSSQATPFTSTPAPSGVTASADPSNSSALLISFTQLSSQYMVTNYRATCTSSNGGSTRTSTG